MKEIIKLRKENEKHFLCEDGTINAYCYKDSMHFLDNGEYKEIDNTLILDNNFYKNKANDFKVLFASCKDNSLLYKIEQNNNYIEFSLSTLKSDKCEIMAENNSIKYKNIYDKIDYVYQVIGKRIKETIILNSLDNINIRFLIRTNLDLVLEKNTIKAYQDGKTIYKFEPPFMYDSEDNRYFNIQYILEKKDGYYVLTLDLNKEWLKEAKLPVYIDPNITTVKSEVHDTYVFPGDENFQKDIGELKIGVDEQNNIYRTLIKFDLPGLYAGSEIINAMAYFTSHKRDLKYEELPTTYEPILAQEIISDWDESTANWNNIIGKINPTIESQNYFLRTIISKDDHSKRTFSSNAVEITDLVKRWYNGRPNNGIMLKFLNEEYNPDCKEYMEFSNDSNYEDLGDMNDSVRPFLKIQYINTGGISSHRQYDNYSFKNGTSYLDVYNGNLTILLNINNTLGGKFPVTLNAILNNSVFDERISINAKFWKFSLLETIERKTEKINQTEREYIHYIDSTNKTTNFYKVKDEDKQNEYYQNEEGLNLTLTEEEDKFTITDRDGNIKTFTKKDKIYYLTKITNTEKNEVKITLNDNNQITKVIDGSNQEINISYDTNKITVTTSEKTAEIHLDDNKIIKLTTKAGTTNITYSTLLAKINISQITDENGMGVKFNYIPNELLNDYSKKLLSGLIYKVTELGAGGIEGQTIKYDYGFNTTKVTNDKNQTYTYIFDNLGMAIGTTLMDSSGRLSESYGFNQKFINIKGDKKNNKPLSETPPIKFAKNLLWLPNTSFENDVDKSLIYGGERTTEYARTGKYSYKASFIECRFSDDNTNLVRGKDYIFSGYLKSDNPVRVDIATTNPNMVVMSETIYYNGNKDFQQIIIPFKYPDDPKCSIRVEIQSCDGSYFYLDDIQIEEGRCASKYNLVENPCFLNGTEKWNISAYNIDTGEEYNNAYSIVDISDTEKALKINSRPDSDVAVSYKFPLEGKKGDTYHLSFWYKDEGLYSSDQVTEMEGNKANIQFIFKDELMGMGTHDIVFNKHSDEWQFFSESFIAEEDYSEFNLNILSLLEANSLYFTNVMLVKELGEYSFQYDEEGNLISSSDLAGNESTLKYDTNNQLIGAFNPKGNNYKYEYDNDVKTRVLKGISPTGISNEIKYDNFGNPVKTIINNVNPDGIIKDDKYYQIRLKGTKRYIDINFDLNKISIKDDNCNHKEFKLIKVVQEEDEYYRFNYYDKYITFANNSLYLSKALDDSTLFKLTPLNNASYTLTPKSEQAKIVNGENIPEKCITVTDDEVSVEINDRENSFQQFYFEDTSTNKFIESTSEYTEDGKFITKMVDNLGKETLYDVDSKTGLLKSLTNAKEVVTNYTYNAKDQVKTITSNNKTVTYDYNKFDYISRINSGTKNYNFDYDDFLNTKKIDINGQTLVTNNFEEKNGNLLSSIYGNGNKIEYTYDEFNRLKTFTNDDKTYTNIYNNIGELGRVISFNENHNYFYDFANRLSRYLLTDFDTSFEVDYNYDKNGNVVNKEYNLFEGYNNHFVSSKINYEYNEDDSVIKVMFDNHSLNNVYDYLGRLEKRNIDNNLNIEYTYYGNGNKTSLTVKSVKIDEDLYEYKYDDLYNITDIYLNGELINHYEYDLFNQLTSDMDYVLNRISTFNYDEEGNILDKREYNLETNELIKEDTFEYTNTNWEDQLTKFNNEVITYDEIGNPLTIGDKTLNWKNGRQLKRIWNSDNTLNVMYEYNKDGIRTSKIVGQVNKTEYYLEGSNIVVAKTGKDVLYFIRDDVGSLIGFKYNDTMYYYVKNLQEDIIGIKDSEFNLVASYVYDAWGKVVSVKDANGNEVTDKTHIAHINPFRYRSYYYDEETGLYYLNSRYYNPLWGRFINTDKMLATGDYIMGLNLYLYCFNNPIINHDTDGYFFKNAWNGIKKVAKKAWDGVKNAWNGAVNTTKNVFSAIKDAFTFDVSVGIGISTPKGKVLSTKYDIKGKTGIYKDMGIRYSGKEGLESYTTFSAGVTAEHDKYSVGLSYSMTHNDDGLETNGALHDNPMAFWSIINCENTLHDVVWGFKYDDKYTREPLNFVGIDYELHYIIGGHIRIGFNY